MGNGIELIEEHSNAASFAALLLIQAGIRPACCFCDDEVPKLPKPCGCQYCITSVTISAKEFVIVDGDQEIHLRAQRID